MIPDFLDEYKEEIKKYELETIRIEATPVTEEESLPIIQSKFLGFPYLPNDVQYPKDKKGKPMIMLAQINFAEIPYLAGYPTSGILQFFIPSTDWYDMDDYKVLFHDNITLAYQKDFAFLTKALYDECPVYCEHSLIFEKFVEYGGTEDCRFNLEFAGKDYFDFYETLTKVEQKQMDNIFDATGHKIGGYAYFTQDDPRGYDSTKKSDVLLLQIDTDDKIMFGDSGVANLFITPEHLRLKQLDKAYFNWDCC